MGGEVNHNGVRVDITPHARDYLNLVSQLWRKTWIRGIIPTEDFSKRREREGAGAPAPFEVVAFQIEHMWTVCSNLLEHAG